MHYSLRAVSVVTAKKSTSYIFNFLLRICVRTKESKLASPIALLVLMALSLGGESLSAIATPADKVLFFPRRGDMVHAFHWNVSDNYL